MSDKPVYYEKFNMSKELSVKTEAELVTHTKSVVEKTMSRIMKKGNLEERSLLSAIGRQIKQKLQAQAAVAKEEYEKHSKLVDVTSKRLFKRTQEVAKARLQASIKGGSVKFPKSIERYASNAVFHVGKDDKTTFTQQMYVTVDIQATQAETKELLGLATTLKTLQSKSSKLYNRWCELSTLAGKNLDQIVDVALAEQMLDTLDENDKKKMEDIADRATKNIMKNKF